MSNTLTVQHALLCSDVHLSNEAPALTRGFLNWIKQQTIDRTTRPDALVILGDLFDAWIGDDVLESQSTRAEQGDASAHHCETVVVQALRSISDAGIQLALMHGNRDFLLGKGFASACGAVLLDDPSVLQIDNGPRIVIAHGDQLCTKDVDYQQFRQQVRNQDWQRHFLSRPLWERQAVAQQLRTKSEIEKGAKGMEITDVTITDAELLSDRMNADMLLHGHTHRPGVSRMPNGKMRWVLPDWEINGNGKLVRGGGLWVDPQGVQEVAV